MEAYLSLLSKENIEEFFNENRDKGRTHLTDLTISDSFSLKLKEILLPNIESIQKGYPYFKNYPEYHAYDLRRANSPLEAFVYMRNELIKLSTNSLIDDSTGRKSLDVQDLFGVITIDDEKMEIFGKNWRYKIFMGESLKDLQKVMEINLFQISNYNDFIYRMKRIGAYDCCLIQGYEKSDILKVFEVILSEGTLREKYQTFDHKETIRVFGKENIDRINLYAKLVYPIYLNRELGINES